jgi:putative membrane protein
LLAVSPSVALAEGEVMMDYHWGMSWYGMVFGPIIMIAVLATTVIVVVLLVRWLSGTSYLPPPHHRPEKTPLDILKERFARGEIEKQEFEEKKRFLSE